MLTYYATLYRVTEHAGTTTSTVRGVYQLRAWNTDEAVKLAHDRIKPGATYEYLRIGREAPKDPSAVVYLEGAGT